jgi:c-di-GMP-binding flagellar brake protein YcgR
MIFRAERKRQFPRLRAQLAVRYQVRGTPEFSNTLADNISVGGVSVVNNAFIRPATALNLEINVLSRILSPVGKVVWATPLPHSNRYKLGIQFVDLDPVSQRYLADYIGLQQGTLTP